MIVIDEVRNTPNPAVLVRYAGVIFCTQLRGESGFRRIRNAPPRIRQYGSNGNKIQYVLSVEAWRPMDGDREDNG